MLSEFDNISEFDNRGTKRKKNREELKTRMVPGVSSMTWLSPKNTKGKSIKYGSPKKQKQRTSKGALPKTKGKSTKHDSSKPKVDNYIIRSKVPYKIHRNNKQIHNRQMRENLTVDDLEKVIKQVNSHLNYIVATEECGPSRLCYDPTDEQRQAGRYHGHSPAHVFHEYANNMRNFDSLKLLVGDHLGMANPCCTDEQKKMIMLLTDEIFADVTKEARYKNLDIVLIAYAVLIIWYSLSYFEASVGEGFKTPFFSTQHRARFCNLYGGREKLLTRKICYQWFSFRPLLDEINIAINGYSRNNNPGKPLNPQDAKRLADTLGGDWGANVAVAKRPNRFTDPIVLKRMAEFRKMATDISQISRDSLIKDKRRLETGDVEHTLTPGPGTKANVLVPGFKTYAGKAKKKNVAKHAYNRDWYIPPSKR